MSRRAMAEKELSSDREDNTPRGGVTTKKTKGEKEGRLAMLEAQVALLLAERDSMRADLRESQEDSASLRSMVTTLRTELHGVREATERFPAELKSKAMQPLEAMRTELQGVLQETAAFRARLGVLEREMSTVQGTQQGHTQELKDVGIFRAQQSFLQAAADRTELAGAEQSRIVAELRAEVAGLQQRHASLASSSGAEHAAHRQAQSALRSTVDTASMQLEALQSALGGLQASGGAGQEAHERLKKAAKRQELTMQRMAETSEARAGELRGLIKSLADQLKPLHDTSRRHAAQIEELSSGINVLAELLKFTGRSRSNQLAEALHAV
jgi:chromosome segregation ATPase